MEGEKSMKYYPLECVDRVQEMEGPEQSLAMIKDHHLCDEDATIQDLHDYAYGITFFTPEYHGKFEKWNQHIMFDQTINKIFFPMYPMTNFDQRQTEWKDILTTNLVLDMWSKFKMVYKIDNDFFHELKHTDNIITSKSVFENLPFNCFFIDLTEVQHISDFRGAWVYIYKDPRPDKDFYCVNIYMVKGDEYTFFTYYSWYKFREDTQEVEWKPEDLPKADFIARTFVDNKDVKSNSKKEKEILDMINSSDRKDIDNYDLFDISTIIDDYDPRNDIVVTIFQILSFIAIDASDVSENENTKQTYRPRKEGSRIKNKFSEIRMWDVGVRYRKAIRVAKQEYKRQIEKENGSKEYTKDRKPTRPHIRRAHWHRYRVGEGRKILKPVWLAPIYVCGTKEIPVTIREIKK